MNLTSRPPNPLRVGYLLVDATSSMLKCAEVVRSTETLRVSQNPLARSKG
jgi:hypothetical protein